MPGKGKGRPPSEDLPPDQRCDYIKSDSTQCGNIRSAGSETQRCRFHGGQTKKVIHDKKQAVVDRALAPFGVAPKEVRPSDFPVIAAEYVAHFNEHFTWVKQILSDEHLIAEGTDAEFLRDNRDLLNELKNTTLVVTRLMEAAGKIGITLDSHGDYTARVAASLISAIVECLEYAAVKTDIDTDLASEFKTNFAQRLGQMERDGRLEVLR